MIVVDTNILAHLFIENERTPIAQAVHIKDRHWIAPALWRHEFLNILAMHIRFKGVRLADATRVWEEAIVMMNDAEYYPDASQVLRMTEQWTLSAYDAQFVALAEHMDVACVTEDKELLRKCPDIAVRMEQFVEGCPPMVREKKAKYSTKTKVQPVPRVKPYKGKFPLTDEFISAAKREGRA